MIGELLLYDSGDTLWLDLSSAVPLWSIQGMLKLSFVNFALISRFELSFVLQKSLTQILILIVYQLVLISYKVAKMPM